jgi:hypothetical protein
MSTEANDADGVGYMRPPKTHQFRPGQSGNPAGRPKGVRSFAADMRDELAELISYGIGDQKVEITKQRVLIKNLIAAALAGDARAVATVTAYSLRTLGNDDDRAEEAEAPEDREIMQAVAAQTAKRRSKNSATDHSSNQEREP